MGFQYMLPSFLSYLNIYNLGNSIIFPMEGQSTDYIMKQIHKANSLLKCRLKSLFMWTRKSFKHWDMLRLYILWILIVYATDCSFTLSQLMLTIILLGRLLLCLIFDDWAVLASLPFLASRHCLHSLGSHWPLLLSLCLGLWLWSSCLSLIRTLDYIGPI